jgi:hypothetical protein
MKNPLKGYGKRELSLACSSCGEPIAGKARTLIMVAGIVAVLFGFFVSDLVKSLRTSKIDLGIILNSFSRYSKSEAMGPAYEVDPGCFAGGICYPAPLQHFEVASNTPSGIDQTKPIRSSKRNAGYPAYFPVPQFPGSKIVGNSGSEKNGVILLRAIASPSDICDFYKNEFRKLNWFRSSEGGSISSDSLTDSLYNMSFNKDETYAHLIVQGREGGGSIIQLSLLKHDSLSYPAASHRS